MVVNFIVALCISMMHFYHIYLLCITLSCPLPLVLTTNPLSSQIPFHFQEHQGMVIYRSMGNILVATPLKKVSLPLLCDTVSGGQHVLW